MNKRDKLIRGLVSDSKSGARVDSQTFPPSADLAHVVDYFWVVRWDFRGQPSHTARLLGDPCVHIAFEAGSSRVVGVWTRTWERTIAGQGIIRAVKLRAGAAPYLIEAPISEFTDKITPLSHVLPCDAPALESRLLEPANDQVAFAEFGRWLTAQLRDTDAGAIDQVDRLLRRIRTDTSIITVDSLVAAAKIPKRNLQRLFKDLVGASPKWVIRRHRLQEAALQIAAGEMRSLSALAAELGYSDQAHLSRDFKSAVGETPREYAKRCHA